MKSLNRTWIILEAREADLPSEVQKKIAAAAELLPLDRILLLATETAHQFLEEECAALPPENVWLQPSEWGNATALAWCFRELEKVDPQAQVLFIPSRGDFPSASEVENLVERMDHKDHAATHVFFLNLPGNHIPDSALLGSVSTLLLLLMMSCPQLVRPWMDDDAADQSLASHDFQRDLHRDVLLGNPLFLEEWNMLPENDAALGILSFQRPIFEGSAPHFTLGSVN